LQIHVQDRFFDTRIHPGFEMVFLSIDTTFCELATKDPIFFSRKHNKYGLKFETAVRLSDGKLCWVSDGFAASIFDKSFHDDGETSVSVQIPQAEERLADKAYQGHPSCVTPFKKYRRPLTQEQTDFNQAHMTLQARVEMTNNVLKVWGVLKTKFRGEPEKQNQAFQICAHLSNVKLQFSD
jgi:hypothetical protein